MSIKGLLDIVFAILTMIFKAPTLFTYSVFKWGSRIDSHKIFIKTLFQIVFISLFHLCYEFSESPVIYGRMIFISVYVITLIVFYFEVGCPTERYEFLYIFTGKISKGAPQDCGHTEEQTCSEESQLSQECLPDEETSETYYGNFEESITESYAHQDNSDEFSEGDLTDAEKEDIYAAMLTLESLAEEAITEDIPEPLEEDIEGVPLYDEDDSNYDDDIVVGSEVSSSLCDSSDKADVAVKSQEEFVPVEGELASEIYKEMSEEMEGSCDVSAEDIKYVDTLEEFNARLNFNKNNTNDIEKRMRNADVTVGELAVDIDDDEEI